MKSKYLILAISMFSLMFISCQSSKKINNVRELMEDDGWEYVQRVVADAYYPHDGDGFESIIIEGYIEYDVFKRGNDYIVTRRATDEISLDEYETGNERLEASYWIICYAYTGNFTNRGKSNKRNITKHYNATTGKGLYFNIITSVGSSEINEGGGGSHATMGENEETYEPAEQQKRYKPCPLCNGCGRCQGCQGTCVVYNAIDYSPGQYVDCGACGGTGQCGFCDGSGTVEDLGW